MNAFVAYDPDKIHARLVELGEQWCDANAAADILEETRKSVLAEIMVTGNAKSRAEREDSALSSSIYKQHLSAMVDARRVANRKRVQFDAAKVKIELMRSMESTRRAEMTLR